MPPPLERLDHRPARSHLRVARNHPPATAIPELWPTHSTAAYRRPPLPSNLRRQGAVPHPEQPPRPRARPAFPPGAGIVRHEVAWAALPEPPELTKDLSDPQRTSQTDSGEGPRSYVLWGPPRASPDPRSWAPVKTHC